MSEWNAETAEWYAEKYGEYPTNRLAVDAISTAPDATIVDVGCGTGSALRRLASTRPSGDLIGIDPVPRMLEIARTRATEHPEGHRIRFILGRAEHLPLEDDFADWLFAFDSFDHWSDKAAGLTEAYRVLKPTGRMVVVKDGGLPGGGEAKRQFTAELKRASFEVFQEQDLSEGNVACTMWLCSPT